jgi:hypothetical protein
VKFNPKQSDKNSIARIIKEQTGHDIALDQPGIKIAKLRSTKDMLEQFASISPVNQVDQIALLTRRTE